MKKLIYLFFVLTMLSVQSCSDDKGTGLKTDIPATEQEIQGAWNCYKNGTYYDIKFDKGTYELDIRNVFADDPFDIEIGTYTMEGNAITLHPTNVENTIFTSLDAYWQDQYHSVLLLYPIGGFTAVR